MSLVSIGIFVVVLLIVLLTLWSAIHTVQEGDVEIVLVFGEAQGILEPGLNIVPPFVSATYRIDLQTMQYETSHVRRAIPSEFRDEVERITADRANAAEAQA